MAENQNEQKASPRDDNSLPFPVDSHAPKTETQQPKPGAGVSKLSTETMEVHKHPHHLTHKKKWTEYLLEFFMIFLAVTAGFFAENIREKLSEHKREKEYVHSLLSDLRSDTMMISRTLASNQHYYNDDSALLRLLAMPVKDPESIKRISFLYPQTEKFIVEINDPKTFEQLKNTGDIRLIRKQAVLDSMSSYYQKINRLAIFRDEIQSSLQTTYNLSDKIFDTYSFDNDPGRANVLITNDPSLLKEYTNKLYRLARNLKKYDRSLELLRNTTRNFIKTIEASYEMEIE